MPANNDSYVPLQRLYNSSKRALQIIVRQGNPNYASRESDVPIRMSRLVNLLPGRTLNIEPNRVDEAQLSRYQNNISVQINRTASIGVIPSKTPTAYVFNGTFYLECQNPTGLPTDNQERSMFGWVKPARSPNGSQALFGYGPVDTGVPYSHSVLIYNWEDNRDVELWGSSAYYRSPSQNVLVPDKWNFVGMTWNGRTLTTYVNGLSWPVPARSLNTVADVFRVGFILAGSTNLFIGDVRSISIWDVAKNREYVEMVRELGPVEFNEVPPELLYSSSLTDCVVSQNLYKTVGLNVITPPGQATVLEASTGKEYDIDDIESTQSEYITSNMTEISGGNMTVMSKDYELEMLRTSNDDTISGSSGGDAFYTSSKTMVSSTLELRSRSALPVQNIEVYHDGSLSNLSSRSVSNVPVFSLSARIKDTPESSQLRTSDNSVLKFSNSAASGPISYWNLSDIGDTKFDSVADNDLIKIAV